MYEYHKDNIEQKKSNKRQDTVGFHFHKIKEKERKLNYSFRSQDSSMLGEE